MSNVHIRLENTILEVEGLTNLVNGLTTLIMLEGDSHYGESLKLALSKYEKDLDKAKVNLDDIKATFGVKYWG